MLFRSPIYGKDNLGVWDCGQIRESQLIEYFLEVQYLGDVGGTSGDLLVTNIIPEGLSLDESSFNLSAVERIISGDGGETQGSVKTQPVVKDGVISFTVTGLSAGARYVLSYSCTAPETAPTVYTEYINTASVNDSGLCDSADPVRNYMGGSKPTQHELSYSYSDNILGAPTFGAMLYTENQIVTLPVPTLEGYTFNGWRPEERRVGKEC